MPQMPGKPGEERGSTVPVPPWWKEEVERAKGDRTDTWIAEQIRDHVGREYSRYQVVRCRTGNVATLELVLDMSTALGIPKPWVMARTKTEALALAGTQAAMEAQVQEQLRTIDAQLGVLKAGVEEDSKKRQTVRVDTEHARRGRPERGKRQR